MTCDVRRAELQAEILVLSVWKNLIVSSVIEIKLLSDTLSMLPWIACHVQQLVVRLEFEIVMEDIDTFKIAQWWPKDFGGIENFVFCDRLELRDRLDDRVRKGDTQQEWTTDMRYARQLVEETPTSGPDGEGPVEGISNFDELSDALEASVLQLPNLHSLSWQTKFVPMTERLCDHLGALDRLTNFRISQQGEFLIQRWKAPPLWKLFPPGKELDVVMLGSPLDPNTWFGESCANIGPLPGFDYKPEVVDLRSADGWRKEIVALDTARLTSVPVEQLHWVEKPVAVTLRTLEALSKTKLQLFLFDHATVNVLRFRYNLPFWLRLPFSCTQGDSLFYFAHYGSFRDESLDRIPMLESLRALRPEFFQLATRLGKKGLALDAGDLMSLHESDLGQVAEWIKQDEPLRLKMANAWNEMIVHEDRSFLRAPADQESILHSYLDTDRRWFWKFNCRSYFYSRS